MSATRLIASRAEWDLLVSINVRLKSRVFSLKTVAVRPYEAPSASTDATDRDQGETNKQSLKTSMLPSVLHAASYDEADTG